MAGKLWFVLGAGVGYVLGARAGRQAYEKFKTQAAGVWQSSPVQRGVSQAQERARDIPVVGSKVASAVSTATDKVDDAAASRKKPAPTNG